MSKFPNVKEILEILKNLVVQTLVWFTSEFLFEIKSKQQQTNKQTHRRLNITSFGNTSSGLQNQRLWGSSEAWLHEPGNSELVFSNLFVRQKLIWLIDSLN